MDLKKLKPYGFYFLAGAIFIANLVVAFWFLPQQVNKITEKWQNLQQTNQEITELSKTISNLENSDKNNLVQNLFKATAALPDKKKTSGLVTGLSDLAGQNGVIIKSLEFSPGKLATGSADESTTIGNGVKAITASLEIGTDLPTLIIFLKKLQKVSQILGITSVEFTGKEASLPLLVYYQPPRSGALNWKQVDLLTTAETEVLKSLESKDVFTLPPE
ncbi:hypothetical protein HY085_01810 [Candidatus Gottesmanbacteria bacterium]|nr:hypothetical protein [Candidatus Gottesmanbacteria bacterium]